MSLRWILDALQKQDTKLYLVNGLTWIPLFLSVRVLIIPRLLSAYMYSDWSVFNAAQYWTALLTLPIPSMLNLYWAQQIIVGAAKFLITGEAPGGAAPDTLEDVDQFDSKSKRMKKKTS
jgi:hypothetical protein